MLKLVVFRAYGAAWLPFSFSLPTDPGQPSARPVDDHDEKLLGIRRPGPARRRKITQPERDGIETRDEKPPKPCNPSCVSIRVSPVSSSAVMVNDRACLAPAGVRGCSLCPSFGGGYIHFPARKLIAELVHTAAPRKPNPADINLNPRECHFRRWLIASGSNWKQQNKVAPRKLSKTCSFDTLLAS
jgi:hypothetical protein